MNTPNDRKALVKAAYTKPTLIEYGTHPPNEQFARAFELSKQQKEFDRLGSFHRDTHHGFIPNLSK